MLSHNALVAGPGNKGSEPETRLEADTIGRIAGTFTLTPVAAPWPSIVSRWFSSPGPPVTPVTPFYRSYDP